MKRELVFPIALGLVGITLLCSLGVWQLKRLDWKTKILVSIEQRIFSEPRQIPSILVKDRDQYLSVKSSGIIQSQEIHVLTSLKNIGPGFLVISPLKLSNGDKIMIEKGFIPETEKNLDRFVGEASIVGNLLWPNEIDGFTPEPNIEKNIWFGRDLNRMAEYLETDPVLVIARAISPAGKPLPQRVGAHIANNHLSYAITWFSLACVWLGMTILLVYRIKKH